jgi:hypothetical protein
VKDVIRQTGAPAEIVEAAATDDAERDTGLAGDLVEQVPSRLGQFRRGGIRVELRDGAIEIEQQYKGSVWRARRHGGLNFGQHL